MNHQVMAHWSCQPCEVEGRDATLSPECWNCGGAVTITARPTVPVGMTGSGADSD
ncbi:MAG TPA: hypothetical protein VGH99_16780 [Pseudonocardia sp.]|jgi:ABC-type ATPase with predicted acetyltransferase domain